MTKFTITLSTCEDFGFSQLPEKADDDVMVTWCGSWLVTAALLSGLLGSSHQSTVPESVKDRSPPYRPGRLGHFRSPKHNSIAKYYQEVRRPTVRECVDPELPQRVRDAAAIFTGTVRDLVKDDARTGQTAIVEIKRVIKGDAVVNRFTSSPADVYHAASHYRRRRRMVAVTGLEERGERT